MEGKSLTLVESPRKKKKRRIIILLCLLLILGVGAYFAVTEFSITNIEISGSSTYSDAEIVHALKEEDYVPNTLLMILKQKIFHQTYLPFISHVDMSYSQPHVLKVYVKEKLRAGVFEYMGKYVYFNESGMAMESRNHLFSDVPVVTGVEFDKLVLGKKIPTKGDYFDTIVSITKKIASYELEVSKIHFEEEDDITLVSGSYLIYLGTTAYLDDKMSKIPSVLESVAKTQKEGTIDMHLYTLEKNIITFRK